MFGRWCGVEVEFGVSSEEVSDDLSDQSPPLLALPIMAERYVDLLSLGTVVVALLLSSMFILVMIMRLGLPIIYEAPLLEVVLL